MGLDLRRRPICLLRVSALLGPRPFWLIELGRVPGVRRLGKLSETQSQLMEWSALDARREADSRRHTGKGTLPYTLALQSLVQTTQRGWGGW